MYGKTYQAETILRKNKKRPFAKEIIKEVNDGEDLFNALFSQNIKDMKQKVKQDHMRSNPRLKNINREPIFAAIAELPESENAGASDLLDPFDALLKATRDHVEKNKVDICDSQSKLSAKFHEDEKENSLKEKRSLGLDDKNKRMVFGSAFQENKRKIPGKPYFKTFKKQPLKLKSERKGGQMSRKRKEKLKPDLTNSYINLIDSSCDSDTLEDEFKAKREEFRKKKEEHYAIIQSKSSLQNASGCEVSSKITCSGSGSYSICSHLSSPDVFEERKRNVAIFVSSTPSKRDSPKQCRVSQVKQEQTRECNGYKFSTAARHTPEELPCFLSPIVPVVELRYDTGRHEQINENQMNMKYWKEMYKKLNPTPVAIQKITVQPYVHASCEDSDRDNSISETVRSFKCKKKNISSFHQSPDPFADSDVFHEHCQTSCAEKDCLIVDETQLEDVHEQSSSTCKHVNKLCHNEHNNIPQETDLRYRVDSFSDFIGSEANQSKNNCLCKYISHIEEDYIGCVNSQNTLKGNCLSLQVPVCSPSVRNVCFQSSYRSFCSNSGQGNTSSVVKYSNQLLKSESANLRISSSCSSIHAKLGTREKIPESIEISSQNGSICERISKLSLSESRSSCKTVKKKSFAPRKSYMVVPLAQNMCQGSKRISGFREVYIGTPSQRQCMHKKSSLWQQVERTGSILKYGEIDNELDEEEEDRVTFKDVVLEHCGQTDVLAFDEAFSHSDLADCIKIGEGVYGEVFALMNTKQQPTVMKIMPIEGDFQINGEHQKSFEEILPEIVISAQLSRLRENEDFSTPNFPELVDCWCVQGKYPPWLLKLWQEYDDKNTSENDSPEMLPEDQIYIILELSNMGSALENFTFNSAEQSWSLFMQVTYTLAVAEASLEFEHRDLHWGNILIKRTKDKTTTFKMYGEDHVVPTQGIQASVIDFTLSRITYDGCCIYNNLAEDPALFDGKGDYQFDIYRMMRDKTENNWQVFEPYNNVLWLSYILEKLITESYYRNEKTKIHRRGSAKLKEMRSHILGFKSATEVALSFST